jgi:hypothetical protein
MRFYSENPNIPAVRDCYRQKYGLVAVQDDCKKIKGQLNKTLRAAIRHLKMVTV